MRIRYLTTKPTLRNPSGYERQQISKWLEAHYNSVIRSSKSLTNVLTGLGVVLLFSASGKSLKTAVFLAVMGLLCFVGVFAAIKGKNDDKERLLLSKNGKFMLLDGHISYTEVNFDRVGCCNAWFTSDDNTIQNYGPYPVRKEDGDVGQRAIMVCLDGMKTRERIFTPYMLTDEGIKHHS